MTFSFRPAEVIHLAVNSGLGEYPRRFLETGRRNKRIGRKRRLGNAQKNGLTHRHLTARFFHALILFLELELIDHFFRKEFRIADIFNTHPAHHLTRDNFEVLIVDIHALETINFLNLVDEILL